MPAGTPPTYENLVVSTSILISVTLHFYFGEVAFLYDCLHGYLKLNNLSIQFILNKFNRFNVFNSIFSILYRKYLIS